MDMRNSFMNHFLLFIILIIKSINYEIKTLLNAIVADMHNNRPSAGISRGNPGTLQEVIGPGAEELTRIRVTGTLNDKDIAFLHYLCWPGVPKPTGMKVEKF